MSNISVIQKSRENLARWMSEQFRYIYVIFSIGYGFYFTLLYNTWDSEGGVLQWYRTGGYFAFAFLLSVFNSAFQKRLSKKPRRIGSENELSAKIRWCSLRKDQVLRYEVFKKAVFILISIAIPLIIITSVHDLKVLTVLNEDFLGIAFSLQFGLIVSTALIFGFMDPLHRFRKEFWYVSAKECFSISKECFQVKQIGYVNDEKRRTEDVVKFMILGITFYNIYLKKSLGLEINNINRIYSTITTSDIEDGYYVTHVNENIHDSNKLKLVKYLRKLHTPKQHHENNELGNQEEFLIKEKLGDKISTLSAWIVPIIAVLVSIVQLLLLFSGKE